VAYNYLEEDQLTDALHYSEEYMKTYWEPIPELQRITRGRPGVVPKGKPKVTDGTLAAVRRETPKQIIQKYPTGTAMIIGQPDSAGQATAVLTDEILPYANAGGTPYAKALRGVKSTIDVGSAWAECFYNRTRDKFHADYKLLYYRDILFERGKTSEFDSNYLITIDWMTEGDIKAIIWNEKQRKVTKSEWNLPALQRFLDKGPTGKDTDSMTPEEKKSSNNGGFFKLAKFRQVGVTAPWFILATTTNEVVYRCTSRDPRGSIPVHGMVPEEEDGNPLGEALAAISAPKQNLLDFEMQMYQYQRGIGVSPPVKLWGKTAKSAIRLVPDNVIKMKGTKADGDDFEAVNISNDAIASFPQNYGLIKTQIQNETGRRNDSSTSGTAGNPGFSKTPQGIRENKAVTDVSDNHLRNIYEEWQGRVFETLLNIHYAESAGIKELDFKPETMKRHKLESNKVDYGKQGASPGVITFTVNAGTSQKEDNEAETMKLSDLMDRKTKIPNPDDKDMLMYNQIIQNAGVADAEKLKYTDDEIAQAMQMRQERQQMAHEAAKAELQKVLNPQPEAPPQPKLLGESISWQPGDLSPNERQQALAQVGVTADSDGTDTPNAIAKATETATAIDKHAHDTALQADKHGHDIAMAVQNHLAARQDAENAREDASEPQPEPAGAAL
jgi:hypothetical protein